MTKSRPHFHGRNPKPKRRAPVRKKNSVTSRTLRVAHAFDRALGDRTERRSQFDAAFRRAHGS